MVREIIVVLCDALPKDVKLNYTLLSNVILPIIAMTLFCTVLFCGMPYRWIVIKCIICNAERTLAYYYTSDKNVGRSLMC